MAAVWRLELLVQTQKMLDPVDGYRHEADLILWELRRAALAGVALPGYVLCRGGGLPDAHPLNP